MRTTLKNARTGAVLDRTFRAAERVEQAILDKRDMQFLYRDGDDYVFMDTQTYDQINVAPAALGDAADFLVENATANLAMFDDEIVSVELPASVELDDHRDRARRAGRPGVGRPQARHAARPARSSGAAVRERGRPGQGRHPHGRLPHPGVNEDLRSEARERAMGLLYEAHAKGTSVRRGARRAARRPRPPGGAAGRGRRRPPGRVDGLLADHARGWTLERMPVLDRTIMEIATFELLARPEVPTAVVLDEAVELAKRYGTDDSGRFVNGLLSAIAKKVR